MNAIVIDDSRAMRGILKRTLVDMGFAVREANDGKDGLARLGEEGRPDLVLVDWNMPVMNGFEFITAVRKDATYEGMPIVMVTTEVEMHQMKAALDAGATDYLMKPFTSESLRQKIEMLGIMREAA